jgi:alcohol dehydrogenase class IV
MSANIAALLQQDDQSSAKDVLARYAAVGRLLNDRPELDDHAACQYAIWKIEAMVQELGIGTLSRFGLTPADIPAMVELAKKASSMRYNPVKLSDQSLAAALAVAIG